MRRLLVVDDSRAARDALRAALEPAGFELVEAEDGAQALALLSATPIDLALVDLHMPVLDGPSLVRMIRARGFTTPVVLVTAGAETAMIVDTIRSGVSGYVTKPFRPAELRQLVAAVLGLDGPAWSGRRAEVVLHGEPEIAAQLRPVLEGARVTEAGTFERALAVCAERAPALVLLDVARLGGDPAPAALAVRRVAPDAGVFAVAEGAGEESLCAPRGALDGVLPRPVPAPVARELAEVFLRPLVFAGCGTLRAAGFTGDPRFTRGYAAALGRALGARAEVEEPAQALRFDLTRVPLEEAELAGVVLHVRERLDARGVASVFHVPPPLVGPLRARPELARAVVVGPP